MPLKIAVKAQRLAAYPSYSTWVAASAGSGKTKVLTDRVLNLLLEGCSPERILCLTFTKAAAAEMANRLRLKLGEWAILPEDPLQASLEELQGFSPSPDKKKRAQQLFGLALDAPGGLKIQTIHSFCQSLLKRFPLEAGLSPFFEVANDSQQKSLIKKAFYEAIADPLLHRVLNDLILRFSESTLEDLNFFILQERLSFENLSLEEIDKVLQTKNVTKEDLLSSLVRDIPVGYLKEGLFLFEKGSSSDQQRGQVLKQFLSFSEEAKLQNYELYLSLFLTQKGEKRACLLTQKVALESPHFKEVLEKEALRLETWVEQGNALEIATLSKAFLTYGLTFLKAYEQLKKNQSLLDYEDLILKTGSLLRNPGCHWVLYKLDGGLDHILVDEAQDTSPAQWQVIRAVAEEFYASATEDQRERTLFIVGDGKQSIYSFQGADPAVFSQMQHDLRAFAENSGKAWQDIDLTVSFRSTPEILRTVDKVFSSNPLFEKPLQHLPFRKEEAGHVELWPLIEEEDENTLEPWRFPFLQKQVDSPQKRLAQVMAKTIQGWLFKESPLPKPIKPGDILILVRRRTAFVDILIRALKDQGVPVAGIDRLQILEGIAIQDLLKIAEFLLLPDDDLTLATVLKGPLFNLSEEDLFHLAYERGKASLWHRLHQEETFKDIVSVLNDLLAKVNFLTPFALFSTILGPLSGKKKWQERLGPEVLDSFDEFLSLCLKFQEANTPSIQNFLHWVSQEVIELKRDLDQSNQVRVMTVHGSKGLQAPLVFLPDTTQPPLELPLFDFFGKALLWLPPAAKDVALTKRIKQRVREKQQEEYRRLLYVALTRAEDALYVCGWGKNTPESWYDCISKSLEDMGEKIEFEGTSPFDVQGTGWRLTAVEKGGSSSFQHEQPPSFLLPQWLKTPPPVETLPTTLRPSEGDDSAFDPSSLYGTFGTKRGILIHKLLEILPDIPEEKREQAAQQFLSKNRILGDDALGIIQIVNKVFKAYPDLFTSLSQGEVPIMGKIGTTIISGQIDRLIVHEDQVLIIDFKTHGIVPEGVDDIPKTYLKQMALYKMALAQVYSQKTIHCGLLWTEIARLDLLPRSLLKKFTPLIDGNSLQAYTERNQA